jgi:integron integrase
MPALKHPDVRRVFSPEFKWQIVRESKESSLSVSELARKYDVNTNQVFRWVREALNALSFLYKEILQRPLSLNLNFNQSSKPRKLPVVLTKDEMKRLLGEIDPSYLLLAQLLYGSGLRLIEAVRLRVAAIDFDYLSIMVWHGKGGKHRRVTLAPELVPALKRQISLVEAYYQQDLETQDYAGVWLPFALARKYPGAPKELGWHYLFPSNKLSIDPDSKLLRRHHIDESGLHKAVKSASRKVGSDKHVTCHTLRHSFIKCLHAFYPSGQPAAVQIHS